MVPSFAPSLIEEAPGHLPQWVHVNKAGDVQSGLQGP